MIYKTLLTAIGAAKIANFINTGIPVNIKALAVGDGGGVPVEPNINAGLVHEVARVQINSLSIDPLNSAQVVVEAVLPEEMGGFYVREAGLYDDEGNLIAVGNVPESYKPVLASGSGKSLTIKLVLLVSNVSAVTLRIDPSIVLASQKYVTDAIAKALANYALKGHLHSKNEISNFNEGVIDAVNQMCPLADLGSHAYMVLPNGLIIQWMRFNAYQAPTAGARITFPIAFPNACLSVSPTYVGNAGNGMEMVQVFGEDRLGCTLYNVMSVSGGTFTPVKMDFGLIVFGY